MSEANHHKKFNASDIERYYTGKMSTAERHAIEKAALEDPFLADALDGYAHTATAKRDLAKLRTRLEEKTKGEKKAVPFFRQNSWMRAAAVILLLAGAGWLVITLNKSPEKNIADTETSLPPDNYQLTDSVTTTTTTPSGTLPDSLATFNYSTDKLPGVASKDVATVKPPVGFSDNNAAVPQAPPNAEINAAPSAWANKNKNSDSIFTLSASDLAGVEFKGDSIKNLNIVMVENDQALNEVVVLDQRKNRSAAKEMKQPEQIEPIGGWEGYNSYAISNIRHPKDIADKPQAGDVVLSFDIDKEGDPVNIKVVESYCTKCEQEAERILRQGPKWKNRNKKNAKIRIRF